jgi:alcohol dehydrogenase class IV
MKDSVRKVMAVVYNKILVPSVSIAGRKNSHSNTSPDVAIPTTMGTRMN